MVRVTESSAGWTRLRYISRCSTKVRSTYHFRSGRSKKIQLTEGGTMYKISLSGRALAECLGTFWLVLGGCGSAVLSAKFLTPATSEASVNLGIGLLGVSFAFGLTVLTMAYAIGHISGCHLNPAVSLGLWAANRFPASELLPYLLSQLLGAIMGAAVVCLIASGKVGFDLSGGLAANGYGLHSPGGYSLAAGFITELVLTFIFLIIILGATDERSTVGLAPIAIGFSLTLIHLISIPVTNTSVNPARSTGPAVIAGGWGLCQIWLFLVAPIAGAIFFRFFYSYL